VKPGDTCIARLGFTERAAPALCVHGAWAIAGSMLGGILRWPFVATKRLILALAPGQVGAPADVWPVAGLDAERASCILYALRQAAATEEVHSSLCRLQDEGGVGHLQGATVAGDVSAVYEETCCLRAREYGQELALPLAKDMTRSALQEVTVVEEWLSALQLAQVTSDR